MATIYGDSGENVLRGTVKADAIYGLDGDDSIYGNGGRDFIYGGRNGDFLSGGAGDDVLFGETGNDTLSGGIGNDQISGGIGRDVLYDGAGADTIRGDYGDDRFTMYQDNARDVIEGGVGTDTLTFSLSGSFPWDDVPDVRANLTNGTLRINADVRDSVVSIENIETGDGDDQVVGTAGANLIDVREGNNVVYALGGDDTILGGYAVHDGGSELLNGGAGNDFIDANGATSVDTSTRELAVQTLVGGEGNDTLAAGASLATLSGGEGTDEFRFDPGLIGSGPYTAVQATIVDYEAGETIQILGGQLTFIGETEDLGDLEIGYHREGADTVIETNMGQDVENPITIRLADYAGPLTAEDFVLI